MYCRRCHYNLFGLPENRCPECGTPFDPDDEATYWPRPPTLRDRLHVSAMRRWLAPCGLVIIVVVQSLIPEPIGHRYPIDCYYECTNAQSVMADNLSEVLGCWRNQKHGAGLPGDLDLRKARSQVRPRLSPRSDSLVYYGRVHLSPVIESHASGIFFASVYVGFIAIVGPRRFRKWLGLLSVTLLTASLLAPNARALAVKVPWPHRGYVSDFIYVRGFDWSTQEDRSERIIAYEKRPWGVSKKRRVVGFANWGVHLVPEHIFQRLAAEQGIILPEPRRPASGIEPTAEDQ